MVANVMPWFHPGKLGSILGNLKAFIFNGSSSVIYQTNFIFTVTHKICYIQVRVPGKMRSILGVMKALFFNAPGSVV